MKYLANLILLSTLTVALATRGVVRGVVNNTFELPGVARADSDCATFCRFRLCVLGSSGDFIPLPTGFGLPFPPAFEAQPPFICSESGPVLGRVLRVREARVRIRSGRFIRIARLGRRSLRAKFNPFFFSVRDFEVPELFGLSAIRRSKFRSMDQREALENRCVYLPMRTWEVMRADGTVARLVTSRDRRSCVSFISTGSSTMIKVTFQWDTAADMDLILQEPGGFAISFNDGKSPNGGFMFEDVVLGDCDLNEGARDSVEMIEYSGLATPEMGTYTIFLSQFASCIVSTNWRVTVMIGDDTVLDSSGTVAPLAPDATESEIFETLSFDFGAATPAVPESSPESST